MKVNDLKTSYTPINVQSVITNGYVTFLGGSDVVKWLGTPLTFITSEWSGCCLLNKTVASQSQDFAMVFRLITIEGDRFTLSIRTGGYLNLRLRSSDGTIQREIQTTGVPTLNGDVFCYYSWNPTLGVLNFVCKYGTTKETLTSNTLASLVAFTGETSGLYFGNTYAGTYPYQGKMYGGTFSYLYKSLSELSSMCDDSKLVPGTILIALPKKYGVNNTTTIREPNNHPLTVSVSNLATFWS